ncbi:lytic transglycosylase domain-containing protein [Pseudomonas sp. Fig-3]|uniref:lytic transglycosylase domain-containing protein n=1 Tax=unclassified Pseudomonas TaxID=196821 RepID=UPI0011128402|nr:MULTISPECIES: lytic transglycosylase domain-containing protein [unclassified Pseudomonas]TNB81562.1 lytic transglycosylase domain-containing protein [Pseudomonas sp. Fig-3]
MAAHRLILALALTGVTVVQADVLPPPAYQLAAARAGIPVSVLFAIALQESGIPLRGHLMPWPWTLNVAGTPLRFASRDEACATLRVELTRHDPKRIDVGLGQTNLGYHPDRYPSACDALDPRANLAVTAELLREHYVNTGDWVVAAGRYHRPAGGVPAARYRTQFSRHWQRIQAIASVRGGSQP